MNVRKTEKQTKESQSPSKKEDALGPRIAARNRRKVKLLTEPSSPKKNNLCKITTLPFEYLRDSMKLNITEETQTAV